MAGDTTMRAVASPAMRAPTGGASAALPNPGTTGIHLRAEFRYNAGSGLDLSQRPTFNNP
jgi:hypothetical protein